MPNRDPRFDPIVGDMLLLENGIVVKVVWVNQVQLRYKYMSSPTSWLKSYAEWAQIVMRALVVTLTDPAEA